MADEDLKTGNVDQGASLSGVPPFDAAKYLPLIGEMDLSEEQRVEFLRTLWWIMAAFVNLGYGVDSVIPLVEQKALENGADTVEQTLPTHEFNVAADDAAEKESE